MSERVFSITNYRLPDRPPELWRQYLQEERPSWLPRLDAWPTTPEARAKLESAVMARVNRNLARVHVELDELMSVADSVLFDEFFKEPSS